MPNLSEINIESKFSESFDQDPIDIANHIENQLEKFVLSEIASDFSNIYVLERKGLNLFRPYLDHSEKSYGINSIKILSESKIIRIKRYSPNCKQKESILLTDAIGEGNEVDIALSARGTYFSEKKISKVCTYLAKKEGLDKLIYKYPSIEFKYSKLAMNPDEYQEEHRRLLCVYHNRMEPIDGDHPYMILNINQIELALLKEKLQSIISSIYMGEFSIKQDKLLINSKKTFTINIHNPDLFLNGFSLMDPKIYDVDRMQFRFKYDLETSKLRIMALSLVNYHPPRLFKFFHLIFGNCLRKMEVRFCKTTVGCNTRSSQFVVICCPHCIDWNISQYLLTQFEEAIKMNPDIFG